MLMTAHIEVSVLAQNLSKPSKSIVSVGNKDAEVIASQVLSCPAWDEIENGGINEVQGKIMECLSAVSEHDITLIREAVALLYRQHSQNTSLWSRIFLLNRYLFLVPETSLVDGQLFGGWEGTPIENGMVNRLWPFSYDSQNNLQLTGEFKGYFGQGYMGLDEFDYFLKTFGLRKK
jgi:hypothetical protein